MPSATVGSPIYSCQRAAGYLRGQDHASGLIAAHLCESTSCLEGVRYLRNVAAGILAPCLCVRLAAASSAIARQNPDFGLNCRFCSGGEGGIRTHGTRKGSTVFETARFNHSRTSPRLELQAFLF